MFEMNSFIEQRVKDVKSKLMVGRRMGKGGRDKLGD